VLDGFLEVTGYIGHLVDHVGLELATLARAERRLDGDGLVELELLAQADVLYGVDVGVRVRARVLGDRFERRRGRRSSWRRSGSGRRGRRVGRVLAVGEK